MGAIEQHKQDKLNQKFKSLDEGQQQRVQQMLQDNPNLSPDKAIERVRAGFGDARLQQSIDTGPLLGGLDAVYGDGLAAPDHGGEVIPVNAVAGRAAILGGEAALLGGLALLSQSDVPQLAEWADQTRESYRRWSMQSGLTDQALSPPPLFGQTTPAELLNADGNDWHPDIRDAASAYQIAAEQNDPVKMERSMAEIQMAVTTRIDPEALRNNSGPVVHVAVPGTSLLEKGQYLAHAIGANFELAQGNVVPNLGRGAAILRNSYARDKFTASVREGNPLLYSGNNFVVGHVPDIIWTGKIDGLTIPMTPRVNTSIGQQNYNYPPGYMPKVFLSVDVFRKPVAPFFGR